MPVDCIMTCYCDCFVKIISEKNDIITFETRNGNIAEFRHDSICYMGKKDSEGYIRIRIDRAEAKLQGLI